MVTTAVAATCLVAIGIGVWILLIVRSMRGQLPAETSRVLSTVEANDALAVDRFSAVHESLARLQQTCYQLEPDQQALWVGFTVVYRTDVASPRLQVHGLQVHSGGQWVMPHEERDYCFCLERPAKASAWVMCHGPGHLTKVTVGQSIFTPPGAAQPFCHIDRPIQLGARVCVTIKAIPPFKPSERKSYWHQ